MAIVLLIHSLCTVHCGVITREAKVCSIVTSVLCSIVGAILTGLGTLDSSACVNLQWASIVGAILVGIGIILAAISSEDTAPKRVQVPDPAPQPGGIPGTPTWNMGYV